MFQLLFWDFQHDKIRLAFQEQFLFSCLESFELFLPWLGHQVLARFRLQNAQYKQGLRYLRLSKLNRKHVIKQIKNKTMWFPILFFSFGCIPEIIQGCQDMTNASSTYLGIAAGAVIGVIVSWWIYNRQTKTAEIQDLTLNRIKELDENHDIMLKRIEDLDSRHEETLNKILDLNKRIDYTVEKQSKLSEQKEPSSKTTDE